MLSSLTRRCHAHQLAAAVPARALAAKGATAKAMVAAAAAKAAEASAAAQKDAEKNKPKAYRKPFDFGVVFSSPSTAVKLAGEPDSEYPAWLADIQTPRPSLRLIDKQHPEYPKLSRRQKIKVTNEEAGMS